MSVNHRRMKRISRSLTSAVTSWAVSASAVAVIESERYLLALAGYARGVRVPWLAAAAGTIGIAAISGCGTASKSGLAPRALTATTATSTTESPRPGCDPAPGARALATSRSVRVFRNREFVYACLNTGEGFRLGRSGHCDQPNREGIGQIALADRVLAFGLETCGVDTGSTNLIVTRLGDHTQITTFSPTLGDTGPESHYSIDSLVVTLGRTVAWIGSGSGIPGK